MGTSQASDTTSAPGQLRLPTADSIENLTLSGWRSREDGLGGSCVSPHLLFEGSYFNLLKESHGLAGWFSRERGLLLKPEDLSLVLRAHMVEGENSLPQVVL